VNDEWTCEAASCIRFKLIRKLEDLHNDFTTFHPIFTHQLFDDERITGYKGLCIEIYKAADTLFTYLHIEFEAKRDYAADVRQIITSRMLHPYTESLDKFIEHIRDRERGRILFEPSGTKVAEYPLDKHLWPSYSKREPNLASVSFEIYVGPLSSSEMKRYHSLLQMFLLFFIDASSYINSEDPLWEVMLVFERRRFLHESDEKRHYSFVGYATLYKFFAFPDSTRLRVSQIFVAPPHQRKGHGKAMLQEVYRIAEQRKYLETNVEDPAPSFQFLRDLTDMENCVALGFFQPDKKGSRPLRSSYLEEWDEKYAKIVHQTLRITMEQVRRCYEAFKLGALSKADKAAYQQYRLEVKARLLHQNQEEMSALDLEPRKQRLHEMYLELESTYDQLLLRLNKVVW